MVVVGDVVEVVEVVVNNKQLEQVELQEKEISF